MTTLHRITDDSLEGNDAVPVASDDEYRAADAADVVDSHEPVLQEKPNREKRIMKTAPPRPMR